MPTWLQLYLTWKTYMVWLQICHFYLTINSSQIGVSHSSVKKISIMMISHLTHTVLAVPTVTQRIILTVHRIHSVQQNAIRCIALFQQMYSSIITVNMLIKIIILLKLLWMYDLVKKQKHHNILHCKDNYFIKEDYPTVCCFLTVYT